MNTYKHDIHTWKLYKDFLNPFQSYKEESLSDAEDIYLKKIQLFRLQVELFSLQLQLDSQRLQDELQIHELSHLIAATDPYPVDGRWKFWLTFCIVCMYTTIGMFVMPMQLLRYAICMVVCMYAWLVLGYYDNQYFYFQKRSWALWKAAMQTGGMQCVFMYVCMHYVSMHAYMRMLKIYYWQAEYIFV